MGQLGQRQSPRPRHAACLSSAKQAVAPCGATQDTAGGKGLRLPSRAQERGANLVTDPHVFSEMH